MVSGHLIDPPTTHTPILSLNSCAQLSQFKVKVISTQIADIKQFKGRYFTSR